MYSTGTQWFLPTINTLQAASPFLLDINFSRVKGTTHDQMCCCSSSYALWHSVHGTRRWEEVRLPKCHQHISKFQAPCSGLLFCVAIRFPLIPEQGLQYAAFWRSFSSLFSQVHLQICTRFDCHLCYCFVSKLP